MEKTGIWSLNPDGRQCFMDIGTMLKCITPDLEKGGT